MDTSEKYIRMCKKAEEIQELWRPYKYDYVFDKGFLYEECNEIYVLADEFEFGLTDINDFTRDLKQFNKGGWLVWLPRQDQLQEMVDYNDGSQYELVKEFWNWCNTENEYGETKFALFKSMEQLWLSFVMWKLYHKVWNDEKEVWVKVK